MGRQVIVWGENVHERENETVREIYPDGMHNAIAAALSVDPVLEVSTATLQDPEHGLTTERSPHAMCCSGGDMQRTTRLPMPLLTALSKLYGRAWVWSCSTPHISLKFSNV